MAFADIRGRYYIPFLGCFMTDSKHMVRVSVIVPVYKVEAYLPRCIDSILRQSFSDFELILIDDGSPDNSGAICDEYAKRDNRIHVIHQKNARLSAARNAGINIASGEWVALIDSDDWIHKDYLKILLSGVLEDTDLVICDCQVTANEAEEDTDYSDTLFRSVSLKEVCENHIAHTRVWGRLYRRSVIGGLRFISGTEPTEDTCFNELLYRGDMKFRITDAKLYYYYMRPDSAIHSHMGRRVINSINPLLDYLKKIDDIEKRRRIILRCYKDVFSARYGEMYSDDFKNVNASCRGIIKDISKYNSDLELKDQIIMRSFCTFPMLYRVLRIADDPTLLQFEKNQRKKRRDRRRERKRNR